jgi:ATP-dependent Clp protease ATP-binding subunit ClpB
MIGTNAPSAREAKNLPGWANELTTLLPACAHFLLSGNTRDLFLIDAGVVQEPGIPPGEMVLKSLAEIVHAMLARRGTTAFVVYDVTVGAEAFPAAPEAGAAADAALGRSPASIAPPDSLTGLAELIEAVAVADEPIGLLIRSASRLTREPGRLSDREFEFFRQVERAARGAAPGPNGLFNPVLWELDREQDMPTWFLMNNEKLRSLVIPLPDTGERTLAGERFVRRLPSRPDGDAGGMRPPHEVLAEHTAGQTLVAMESIIGVAADQNLGRDRLEDAARAFRVGILDNPWRRPYLTERLRNEIAALDAVTEDPDVELAGGKGAPKPLVRRVLGQDQAVRKALDILVRSVGGMTAAHTSSGSRPRGVLFLAGPTGVGKTELAKGLTKLIFDDERLYIRFDMSEFSAEHASDRLIGAPPGYTGYERGGELTNAVRQQPFSLVLFDEIEKADPRVLDKFLQLLDDGRLTDGRGETAYFTESVIVFTSNLGIYKDRIKDDGEGGKTIVRELNVTLDSPTEEVERKVGEGIREHFSLKLGRPELLNRIGDNIVVFDFIRPDTGGRILDSMVSNVLARVRSEADLDVVMSPRARALLADECLRPEVRVMGGRGIGSRLETVLINPLSTEVFLERPRLGAAAELVDLHKRDDGAWRTVLKSLDPGGVAAPSSVP